MTIKEDIYKSPLYEIKGYPDYAISQALGGVVSFKRKDPALLTWSTTRKANLTITDYHVTLSNPEKRAKKFTKIDFSRALNDPNKVCINPETLNCKDEISTSNESMLSDEYILIVDSSVVDSFSTEELAKSHADDYLARSSSVVVAKKLATASKRVVIDWTSK